MAASSISTNSTTPAIFAQCKRSLFLVLSTPVNQQLPELHARAWGITAQHHWRCPAHSPHEPLSAGGLVSTRPKPPGSPSLPSRPSGTGSSAASRPAKGSCCWTPARCKVRGAPSTIKHCRTPATQAAMTGHPPVLPAVHQSHRHLALAVSLGIRTRHAPDQGIPGCSWAVGLGRSKPRLQRAAAEVGTAEERPM